MGLILHEKMIYSYIFHHDLQRAQALLHFTGASSYSLVLLDKIIAIMSSCIIVVKFSSLISEL